MRIAVVADIHGNVRALRAVMEDIKTLSPDIVVNLGDCASGPLEAAETIDVLVSLAWTTIRGNHDRQLIDRPVDRMGGSDKAAAGVLKNHHSAWLSALEPTAEVEDLLLCHGTPDDDNKYLLETVEPDGRVRLATPAEIKRRLDGTSARVIVCAHSHQPRIAALDDARLIVNPGSVGLPAYVDTAPVPHAMEMGAPHARYALLERHKSSDPWQVSFRVVGYDWNAAADSAATAGREDWARWVRTGYVA